MKTKAEFVYHDSYILYRILAQVTTSTFISCEVAYDLILSAVV